MISAIEIWIDLRRSFGTEAYRFYESRLGDQVDPQSILDQGATDFDQKYFPNDSDEKPLYKTDLYIWQYMDMHLKQNLEVLKNYLGNQITEDHGEIVFVDLGCGPMTSGLALAEILSDRKIIYLGIDVAENMVERARGINEHYQVFEPNRFKVLRGDTFAPQMIAQLPLLEDVSLAILNMSFVLSPRTNKVELLMQSAWAGELAQVWNRWTASLPNFKETQAIYINPRPFFFHENWDELRWALQASVDFSYTGGQREIFKIPSLSRDVVASRMVGHKK